jgi:hypothetical protein
MFAEEELLTVVHESFTSKNAHVAVGNVMRRSCSRISWSATERIWASEQSIVAGLPGLMSAFSWQDVRQRGHGQGAIAELTPSRSRRLRHYRLLALHEHK